MKSLLFSLLSLCAVTAEVRIDENAYAAKLGGWSKKNKQAAEYNLSGARYRTYRPEITPTPDGGIFVSVRIDHMRGMLSSDDYAMLEVTYGPNGHVQSAQSNIAIQGRAITSDVIRGLAGAGNQVTTVDNAVKVGTELVADLTSKLLREKIVEAGRVSFPSVVRHNYNLLFQAVKVVKDEPKNVEPVKPEAPKTEEKAAEPQKVNIKQEVPAAQPIKIENKDASKDPQLEVKAFDKAEAVLPKN